MKTKIFFILAFSFSLASIAMDEKSQDPQATWLKIQTHHEVRSQILKNLELVNWQRANTDSLLEQPVLCIGTGKNNKALAFQPCRTIVKDIDLTIDMNPKVGPDFVCDAWKISKIEEDLRAKTPLGAVFFAHAGMIPNFNNIEILEQIFVIYNNFLISGGLFIYNSEVFHNKAAPDYWAKKYGRSSFNDWIEDWEKVFSRAGFENINIILNDEGALGVSILLVANKILNL